MKGVLSNILKIGIPLGLGVFLTWYQFHDISDENLAQMKFAFSKANYWWILVSITIGVFSHLSRAYRWKYPLESLGYKPKLSNSFYAVMIGYLANLLIPRMGEVSRCGYMVKNTNMKFEKVFGTVIGERVADLILLVFSLLLAFFLHSDLLIEKLSESATVNSIINNPILVGIIIIGIAVTAFVFLKLIQNSTKGVFYKIRKFISGILEGVMTILKMDKKWSFIFHTILIWFFYLAMFYAAILSMDEIKAVPFSGVLSAFIMGGLSIATTNGGLGAYPLAIALVLSQYNVPEGIGVAFGWIIWVAQTIMIVSLGLLSILLIEINNKQKSPTDAV